MENGLEKYGLDMRLTMLLEEYRDSLPVYRKIESVVKENLNRIISEGGLYVTAVETRIKTVSSLAGKLELKGAKYQSLNDLTDLVGARIITFYSDEVDKIAALVDRCFKVDWENSVDKRKMHELDSFGYNSLHFICSIPKKLYFDPEMPEINEVRFELQMRTALQHVWATMNHDTGYKTGVEIPKEYLRNMNRLAGMLELADEQFSQIRTKINEYRRQVQALVSSGKFDEVALNGDTFRSYLELKPFESLVAKIASINQAEIHQSSFLPYLGALKQMGYKTIGDVERLRKENSEDAYQLATYELAGTDLDIISSTIALQDLLVVKILKSGAGELGLNYLFESLNGESPYNATRAKRLVEIGSRLQFMNKK